MDLGPYECGQTSTIKTLNMMVILSSVEGGPTMIHSVLTVLTQILIESSRRPSSRFRAIIAANKTDHATY